MKFSTESGEEFNLTPIDENVYPPRYIVETDRDGQPERYTADLIAPQKVIKGLGVLMLADINTDNPKFVTTDIVAELDESGETVSDRMLRAFEESNSDFRTTQSLSRELEIDIDMTNLVLGGLGDKVRRPLGHFARRHPNWHRLTSRGPTLVERQFGYK